MRAVNYLLLSTCNVNSLENFRQNVKNDDKLNFILLIISYDLLFIKQCIICITQYAIKCYST